MKKSKLSHSIFLLIGGFSLILSLATGCGGGSSSSKKDRTPNDPDNPPTYEPGEPPAPPTDQPS